MGRKRAAKEAKKKAKQQAAPQNETKRWAKFRETWPVPLVKAVISGELSWVKTILKNASTLVDGSKLNVDEADQRGCTALYHAVVCGYDDIVCELLQAGADMDVSVNGRTALGTAVIVGHIEVVKALLSAPMQDQVNQVDSTGRSLLHWAVCMGNADMVRLLVDHGSSKTAKDSDSRTPGEYATWLGRHEVASVL